MLKADLINAVSPCGTLNYWEMISLFNNVEYVDISVLPLLEERLSQSGELSVTDWIFFAKSIVFEEASPIDACTIAGWLSNSCFTQLELKAFVEWIKFTDGSQPTFLISEGGDILIAE